MGNYTSILSDMARLGPDRPALIAGDVTSTYAELDDAVWKLATYLAASGVAKGDIVSVRFADEFLMAHAFLALGRLGATVFVIPRSASPLQQEGMARGVASAICLSDMEAGAWFAKAIPLTRELLAGLSAIDAGVMDAAPAAPRCVMTGSGSTGKPKLIPTSHAVCVERLEMYASVVPCGPDSRIASLLSLELPPAWTQFFAALFNGAAFCILDQGGIKVGPWCRDRGVTVLGAISGQLESLLHIEPELLSSLRAIVPTGAPISDALRGKVRERLGDVLYVLYGATEAGPICIAAPEDLRDTPGTVGRPLRGVTVEIVHEDGSPVPDGQPGHIRVASAGAAERYLGQEDYSRQTFRGNWIHPGDIGKLMPDGQLVHLGRADDMMILNGLNIFPAEIEAVLLAHPAIADAVVRPARHPVFHEIPVAAVCLREGAAASEPELMHHAREALGARAPRRIAIVGEVPRNALGKLDRQALSDILRRDFEIDVP